MRDSILITTSRLRRHLYLPNHNLQHHSYTIAVNNIFERQEYPSAIKTLLELLKLEPNNSKAYNTIGMSFGELKEYSAAVAAFDRADLSKQ